MRAATLDATRADFDELAATGSPELRARLIEAYLPLASRLARSFGHRGEPMDDLRQVASLALVHAVDRFDRHQDVSFAGFATATIVGELKRHFRDKGWAVRPPRRIQELCLELNREIELLTHQLGRSPTIDELSAACDAPPDAVIEALDAAGSYWSASLDAPSPDGDTVGEHLGDADLEFDAVVDRAALAPHLAALPPRLRLVLHLRFVEGLTQSDIADRIGVSQMHVSRLLRQALTALRDGFDARRNTAADDNAAADD
jgi:RNA polymerase sigma-B factor